MADTSSITIPIETSNISPIVDLGNFVGNISGVILILAGIACMVMLVWGGLEWVMSGGDKAKLEESKNKLTNAILGLTITAAAWAIFSLIDHFLGLNIAGKESNLEVPSTSTSTSSTKSKTSGKSDCGGGLNIGDKAKLNGVEYTCVKAGTNCGPNNSKGFNYPFNCPTDQIGKAPVK